MSNNLEDQLNHHSTTYAYYQALLDTKLFPDEHEFFLAQQQVHSHCFCELLGDDILREIFITNNESSQNNSD